MPAKKTAKQASKKSSKKTSQRQAQKSPQLRLPKLTQILQGVRGEEWPPPQDCGDFFDQEGVASMKVENCQDKLLPNVFLQLAKAAQRNAQEKANFRCPSRCPAALVKWKTQTPTCQNNVATLTVVGSFHCK